MSAAIYWTDVKAKEDELIREYVTFRKAKIAEGLPDPYPGQPRDYCGLKLVSIPIPTDRTSVGGRLAICNFHVCARKIVGENHYPSHRVATSEEIKACEAEADERMALTRKSEDAIAGRRIVVVRAADPQPRRSAE